MSKPAHVALCKARGITSRRARAGRFLIYGRRRNVNGRREMSVIAHLAGDGVIHSYRGVINVGAPL